MPNDKQYSDKLIAAADSIIRQIQNLSMEKEFLTIAIDGRCASGKTTLAAFLQESLSCEVVHMDDFFLRPEQRTKERLEEPGGNVDYERFLEEVLLPLQKHQDFSYRPYDCKSQSLKEPVEMKKNAITVVEGAYACHPILWEYYDLCIFCDVDAKTQSERIRMRNGAAAAVRFKELWIPLEEAYFAGCEIEKRCRLCYQM